MLNALGDAFTRYPDVPESIRRAQFQIRDQ
jgi:hypothetical protein